MQVSVKRFMYHIKNFSKIHDPTMQRIFLIINLHSCETMNSFSAENASGPTTSPRGGGGAPRRQLELTFAVFGLEVDGEVQQRQQVVVVQENLMSRLLKGHVHI